jgi:acetyl-CoA carboxylase carboxyl transferase subunit alpha
LRFGIIDQIVREPSGGAHTNHDLAARLLDEPLSRALSEVSAMNPADRLEARYRKFRVMGNIGIKEA